MEYTPLVPHCFLHKIQKDPTSCTNVFACAYKIWLVTILAREIKALVGTYYLCQSDFNFTHKWSKRLNPKNQKQSIDSFTLEFLTCMQ